MKLNRRSFFGRLAAACGLSHLLPALPVRRGPAAFTLPIERMETAFGVVEMLPSRYGAEMQAAMQAAMQRLREDMEMTFLTGTPPAWDDETLARLKAHEQAYTPGWIVPERLTSTAA